MGTSPAGVRVRRYQQGDEVELNRLFTLVVGGQRSLEEWRWKFRDSVIAVAEVDGKIVGQYASFVVRFKVQDKVVWAAQPVDNIIHPEFRGGGRLQIKLFAFQPGLARERGISFGFGFPNEIAYPVGKRLLKYRDLCFLPVLFRSLNWRAQVKHRLPWIPGRVLGLMRRLSAGLHRIALSLQSTQGILVKEASTFDKRFDALWEKAKDAYGVLGVRNQEQLRWRYLAKPTDHYRILTAERDAAIVGYAVVKLSTDGEERIGIIADFFTIQDEAVDRALIRGALLWFTSRGADHALCWMLKEDRVSRALAAAGFHDHPGFRPLPVVFYTFTEALDETFMEDPRNWHLTFGDTDGA